MLHHVQCFLFERGLVRLCWCKTIFSLPCPSRSWKRLLPKPTFPLQSLAMSAFRDSSRRQDTYKAKGAFKQDELRRRREEAQVEIRRQTVSYTHLTLPTKA